MAGRFRAKVPSPTILDENSSTLITLKKWFNVLEVYCQQNEEFDFFFNDGEHSTWIAKSSDATHGISVLPRPGVQGAPADNVNHIAAVLAVEEITTTLQGCQHCHH